MKLLGALGLDWKVFLIQVLNFLILLFLLKWLFFDKFITALKNDKKKAEEIEQGKKEIQRKKEEILKEQERITKETKEKTKQILEEGKEISYEEKERILKRTEEEVSGILEEAKERAKVESEEIKSKEKIEIKNKAKKAIKRVLSSSIFKKLHQGYVDEVINELKKADIEKIKEEVISVTVVSAFPLKKYEKKKLADFLFSKLKNPRFQEKIDKDLIAGIKIFIGDFLIDGSLERKIEEAMA